MTSKVPAGHCAHLTLTHTSPRLPIQAVQEQLAAFRTNLEDFARKYRADIRRDPVFRAQFHTMCANIGVDPLASNKVTSDGALGSGGTAGQKPKPIPTRCHLAGVRRETENTLGQGLKPRVLGARVGRGPGRQQ